MLESMYQGDFLSKSATAIGEFLKVFAGKTIKWETTKDKSLCSRFARGDVHYVYDVSHLESNIIVLDNVLKGISVQQP